MYKLKTALFTLIMSGFIILSGCQQGADTNNESSSLNDQNSNNEATTENMKNNIREEKMEFKQKFQKKIDEVDREINDLQDQLAEKGDNANEEIKAKYNELINDLKDQKESLQDKMNETEQVSENNWEDFKAKTKIWWDKFEVRMEELRVKIKDAFTPENG